MDLRISLYFLFISSSLPKLNRTQPPATLPCSDRRRPPLVRPPPASPGPAAALSCVGRIRPPLPAAGLPSGRRRNPFLWPPRALPCSARRRPPLRIAAAELPCPRPDPRSHARRRTSPGPRRWWWPTTEAVVGFTTVVWSRASPGAAPATSRGHRDGAAGAAAAVLGHRGDFGGKGKKAPDKWVPPRIYKKTPNI
jgi:hypothetical protein